jgi:hypothetical protein
MFVRSMKGWSRHDSPKSGDEGRLRGSAVTSSPARYLHICGLFAIARSSSICAVIDVLYDSQSFGEGR